MESAQLAVDWICGSAGGLADQEIASRLVMRIIVAVDWICGSAGGLVNQEIASRLVIRIIVAVD